MPQISGIYDSGVMQPIAKIKENVSLWTGGKWLHYNIDYCEPIPAGPASMVEMVTLSGATGLAGGATINKMIVAVLQIAANAMMQVRFKPLDNVECVLWEQAGQAKFNSRNIHARVDQWTELYDPDLCSTTFFVVGLNRDMNLEVRNAAAAATPIARVQFWGYRYILDPFTLDGVPLPPNVPRKDVQLLLDQGDVDTVKRYVGPTTWAVAEGRTP